MTNVVTLPTTWACSPTRAEQNRQRQDNLEAAQALLEAPQWQNIDERFYYCVGEQLRPWQLVELAAMPVEPLMIIYAIHDTQRAPRPTYFYLRAILSHCVYDGCRTAEAYLQRNAAHRALYDALYQRMDRREAR